MKKRCLVILLPLLLAACATKPDMVELNDWQFEYNGQWYPATVPGFIHTDLMVNGLIPERTACSGFTMSGSGSTTP